MSDAEEELLDADDALITEKELPGVENALITKEEIPDAEDVLITKEEIPDAEDVLITKEEIPDAEDVLITKEEIPDAEDVLITKEEIPDAEDVLITEGLHVGDHLRVEEGCIEVLWTKTNFHEIRFCFPKKLQKVICKTTSQREVILLFGLVYSKNRLILEL